MFPKLKRRIVRPPTKPKEQPLPLHFRLVAMRKIAVGRGLTVTIGYEGAPSLSQVLFLDKEVVPLFTASAAMADLLRRVIGRDIHGMPGMFEEIPAWVNLLIHLASRAIPIIKN